MNIAMDLLMMLGGVAVFMFGMKQMSSGLEQGAGTRIRGIFKKMNRNRMMNYGIGIGATALVQSSSATSIMSVGLAHAKIISVKQGAGFILGAKVGTTASAYIFALSGLSKGGFSISALFASFAFIGVMIIFTTSNITLNKFAPFLIGFGMLFIGMEVMEMAIGGADSTLSVELSKVFQYDIMQNPFMLVILGILFTSIIQSSSAATGVFIAFLATGVITDIDQSFFLVMGANIGTCSDGIMASLTTNAYGKRIALFHLITSVIGAIAFLFITIAFRQPIVDFFNGMFPNNPSFSLATFNLIYNTIYTLALLLFLDPLVNMVTGMVKDKDQELEELSFIDESSLQTPSVAIEQALKEMYAMAILAKENIDCAYEALINEDLTDSKKIKDNEYRINFLTTKLTSFFIKISSVNSNADDEMLIGGLHHVANDIERLGDYAVLLLDETQYMKENNITFLEETKEELNEIYERISHMFGLGFDAFSNRETENFSKIARLHLKTKKLIAASRDEHVARLSSELYPVEVSKSVYSTLFSLQRISDHLVNVAYSIRSTTGSKTEAMQAVENEKRISER